VQSLIPIVITILRKDEKYLFIKRSKPPYENLWSLVGGKLEVGEHVTKAAVREVKEETGAEQILNYDIRGFVSERLVDTKDNLIAHFLIYVGYAEIGFFKGSHREGELALFTYDEIGDRSDQFLPSDLEMFSQFHKLPLEHIFFEAELVSDDGYHLKYFRRS